MPNLPDPIPSGGVKTPDYFELRVRFICELARRLHQYGTSAPRLEGAIDTVAGRLGVRVQIWSNPTGILLAFGRPEDGEDALLGMTQVIRLDPGEVNLKRLSEVDQIAEQVAAGAIGIEEGYRQLRAARPLMRRRTELLMVLAHGVAAAVVVALLKVGFAELIVAFFLGLAVGAMSFYAARRPSFAAGYEAVAAMTAAFVIQAVGALAHPLAFNQVQIASVIVLLPGLTLTTAITELATKSLVSGVARFAGAATVLLKLGFGTAVGLELAHLCGFDELPGIPEVPLPLWAEWLALVIAGWCFALLFKTARGDYPLVMAASWLGYLSTRGGGILFGSEFGVFVSGILIGVVSNAYARKFNRPGALIRVPGIILLVPGSIGLKSLYFVFQRDVYQGLDTSFSLIVILISLVAGLLFGNLLLPPRRNL
jgi:uncharacterized membrane protein YjjP (DUF1212 family)